MIGILQINYITIISINLAIALLVVASLRKKSFYSKARIHFLGLIISISLWLLSLLVLNTSTDQFVVDFVGRFAFVGPCFVMLFLYLFTFNFPRNSERVTRTNIAMVINSLIFSVISMTPLVIDKIDLSSGSPTPTFGILYFAYAISLIVPLFLAFATLFRKFRTSEDKDREQIKLFSAGFGVTIVIALTTNLILPVLFNDASTSLFGPYSVIPFLFMLAFTILRHQFLEIRVLIGRIVYFILSGSLPLFSFFLVSFLFIEFLGGIFTVQAYLVSPFVAILFVFAFNSLNAYIRNQVNSRLINPGYDPLRTAEQLSSDLSLVIEIDKITEKIVGVISRTIRPDYSSIVIFADNDQVKTDLVLPQTRPVQELQKLISATQTLWQALGRHPIVLDEIDIEASSGIYKNLPNLAMEIKGLMTLNGAKVILSVGDKDNIRGMYLIGQKEADSPYTSTDIDFLRSIANSGSLAIVRSLLYNEVREFANTLQKKVDDATAELKKTNIELEATLNQLQEIRRQERDMIDVMGHELRTPMSIVRNALAILNREYEKNNGVIDQTKLKNYLDMGTESAKREITLIETLLSATKVDASRIQLYFVKVDFKDVVNDGIEGQRNAAADKNIEIKYAPPAEDIFVYTDRTRVQEVMDNFLSNAVKYTPKGFVEIKIWKDNEFGWISVQDSGIGIDEADLQNLGKKFFRAKQYIPKENEMDAKFIRPGGTGLGLYVTFDLIRVMGGKLFVNSKVGEGTRFTFSMPLHKDQADKQMDQTFDAPEGNKRAHVIINGQAPEPTK